MLRSAPRLLAVFLCGAALCGCAMVTGKGAPAAAPDKAAQNKNLPTDLEGGIAQARTARFAGHYDEAVRTLSQLMLVAADDPRVVAEYGKTLAEQGRAQEATEFLNRAIELSSNDWTLYSALGVADDQLGNPVAARMAYEHALALKPNEASVLNNYALSRMMANDADGARILMARAQAAGGSADAKIAANIAMIAKLTPVQTKDIAVAPKPATVASAAPSAPIPPMPKSAAPVMAQPLAAARPAPLPMPAAPQSAPRSIVPSGVVMQAVPIDPMAGPVKLIPPKPKAVAKTDAPKPAAPAPAKTAPSKMAAVLTPPVIVIEDKPVKAQPAKTKDAIPALRLTADARNP